MITGKKNFYQLKAGEHFGNISQTCSFPSAIISESVYEKQTDLPKHSHELAFFTLVLGGRYFDKFGKKEDCLDPMTVLWREEGISHRDRIGEKGGRFFFVEIRPDYLEKLREYHKPPKRLVKKNGTLIWLASRLRREIQHWQSSSPLIVEGITLEMLGHLTPADTSVEKRPPKWLVRVVEKLNEEFTCNLTIKELAGEAGVHPAHLTKVFRLFYNQTIGEYIHKRRIKFASELLCNKEIPLVEIAISSGFSDQSHLTRIFKRLTGDTPAFYRKSLD